MGILDEPVVGWRIYQTSIPGILVSQDNVMMPRERMESFCKGGWKWLQEEGKSLKLPRCLNGPMPDCTCGFYAFNSVEQYFQDGSYIQDGMVAEVAMWGRVLRHSKGYRAQYAYPLRMWAYGDLAETVRFRVQSEYGVPVGLFRVDFHEQLGAFLLRQKARIRANTPLTEEELKERWDAGDGQAGKVLRARLSSAICTRRKALKRLAAQYEAARHELSFKLRQREALGKGRK